MNKTTIERKDIPISTWENALKDLIAIRKLSVWHVYHHLLEFTNPYTLKVNVPKERRDIIISNLGINEQTFWRAIKELKDRGIIIGSRTRYEFSPKILRSLRLDEDYAQYENLFDWES